MKCANGTNCLIYTRNTKHSNFFYCLNLHQQRPAIHFSCGTGFALSVCVSHLREQKSKVIPQGELIVLRILSKPDKLTLAIAAISATLAQTAYAETAVTNSEVRKSREDIETIVITGTQRKDLSILKPRHRWTLSVLKNSIALALMTFPLRYKNLRLLSHYPVHPPGGFLLQFRWALHCAVYQRIKRWF